MLGRTPFERMMTRPYSPLITHCWTGRRSTQQKARNICYLFDLGRHSEGTYTEGPSRSQSTTLPHIRLLTGYARPALLGIPTWLTQNTSHPGIPTKWSSTSHRPRGGSGLGWVHIRIHGTYREELLPRHDVHLKHST